MSKIWMLTIGSQGKENTIKIRYTWYCIFDNLTLQSINSIQSTLFENGDIFGIAATLTMTFDKGKQ